MMEWNTEQYASLFKAIARKFWDGSGPHAPPAHLGRRFPPQYPGYPYAWDKYLDELGIHSSARNDSPSWEELCGRPDIMKINVLYDKRELVGELRDKDFRFFGTDRTVRVRHPQTPNSQLNRIHRLVFAAQDQENVFITDPSLNADYLHFEDWPVEATSVRSEILKVLDIAGGGYRSEQKGGELLTVPKRTAENILVLGLP